jgi:hypothetical protein
MRNALTLMFWKICGANWYMLLFCVLRACFVSIK